MPKSPLILIGPSSEQRGAEFYDYSISLSHAYLDAIIRGGGIPAVISCSSDRAVIAESVARADGVLLTGGDDVQPSLYRADLPANLKKTLGRHDPRRDLAELLLIEEVFRQRKPLLAICRGMQLLNVAFGGTLFVDIQTEVPGAIRHNRTDRKDQLVHQLLLAPGSILAGVFGREKINVNSSHHQAAHKLGKPFRAAAVSPDGIVEALELKLADSRMLPYLLAVQFHPERLLERCPEFVKLFAHFTAACAP